MAYNVTYRNSEQRAHREADSRREDFRGRHPRRPPSSRRRQRTRGPLQRLALLSFSAILFGSLAGASAYGTHRFLGKFPLSYDASQTAGSSFSSSGAGSSSKLLLTAQSGSGQSLDVTEVAAKGLTSVVSVTNISVQEVDRYFGQFGRNGQGPGQLQETVSCGTGVIIYQNDSTLYMVSNYHVIAGASTLSVTFADNETYEAQVCGYDETQDIAVLRVSLSAISQDTLSQISVVSVGDSSSLIVGEQVVAIGNALGYGQSVTTGIVSAVNRTISSDSSSLSYIQTDAAINPGNSGGALLNMDGELVGINTAKVSSTDVEGIGYAIPISQVFDLIQSFLD